MNSRSIRGKITFWFIIVLIVVLAINFMVFFAIGEKVARDTAKDDVREMVTINMDEVRFKKGDMPTKDDEVSPRYAIKFKDGYLEIDDFMDLVSGVACGVYASDGELLYGLNYLPNETKGMRFMDNKVHEVTSYEETFYLFDRMIPVEGGENVWIRGMIDRDQDRYQIYRMYRAYMMTLPALIVLTLIIIYMAIRRSLLPLNRIVDEVGRVGWGSDLKEHVETDSNDYEVRTIVDALNKMLSRLRDSYDAGRRFTSNVSHDLRTPVAIISAQTELALEEEGLSDETREAFENIQKQGERTKEILEGLLTYMRLEDMPEVYEMSPIDISKEARDICDSITILDDKNITLQTDIDENIEINGNKALFRTLLENLLSNAYKYGKENGHVWVRLHRDEGGVNLSVEDDGIGISSEDQKRLFEWMFRSEESGNIEGTGIGLYVVKVITDLHNAKISIKSNTGEGSAFTVIFPEETKQARR